MWFNFKIFCSVGFFLILIFGMFFQPASIEAAIAPPPNLKVAFIADQAVYDTSYSILRLIRNEGAQLVVISGDFDYHDQPADWEKMMTAELTNHGIPYVASIGNHEEVIWPQYKAVIERQLAKFPDVRCAGDLGINSYCTYKGVYVLLSGVGTLGSGHVAYMQTELPKTSDYVWKFCSWHKNQKAMQIGGQKDEVGWEPYELCRQNGAIIATGHEHSYHRTKTLTDMQNQVIHPSWNSATQAMVGPGSTFVFVSGLGGGGKTSKDVRPQVRCTSTTAGGNYPYGCKGEWAKIYTHDQSQFSGSETSFGALFITFNVDGNDHKAKGYFKTINPNASLNMIEQFDIISENAKTVTAPPLSKTCSVTVSQASLTAGQTVTVNVTGNSSRTTQEPVKLFLKRVDSTQIAPRPSGTTEIAYAPNYYYQFGTAVCQTGNLQSCSASVAIPNLDTGSYQVLCDLATQPNACTGNPNCSYEGGTYPCTGFQSCSTTDNARFEVTAAPISKSCSVSLSQTTMEEGQTMTATFTGTSSRSTAEPVQIFLKKLDSTQISPTPGGTTEVAYAPNYYYKFNTTCQTGGGQGCSGTVTIPGQAVGRYQVHCDLATQPNACSGNPNCLYEGGAFPCTGWQSCSGTDSQVLEVTAAPPTTRSPDYNGNGVVDIFDYNTVLTNYRRTDCGFNLAGGCGIDAEDVNYLVAQFGKPVQTSGE